MATATLLLVTLISNACAYIPASPSNDTSFINSESFIQINWLPMGISAYTNALSRQLVNSQGVNGYRVSTERSRTSPKACCSTSSSTCSHLSMLTDHRLL